MNRIFQTLAAAGILALSAGAAHAVPSIDTSGGSFGSISPFGETNTATYGQTFTVTGPETRLDSFAFQFNDHLNPDTVDFAAYVYAWDGVKATGAQLYASGMLTSTNNGGADGYETFSFNTGGIDLVAGQQYVAFLNASDFFDGSTGTSSWQYSSSDLYSGGAYVYENNGSNFAQLFSAAWDNTGGSGRDTWFQASFSTAVPAPGGLALLGLGLAGIGLARRRRR